MRYAVFVRAVMIGRDGLHRAVLLDCFTRAGAVDARSYISTGNVTFDAEPERVDAIVIDARSCVEAVVERPTELYVRSIPYLEQLVASDPFGTSPIAETDQLEVSFTDEPIDPTELALPIVSPGGHLTVFAATEGEIFCAGREIGGRRVGAGGFIERALGQRLTTRAWGTVLRVTQDPGPHP